MYLNALRWPPFCKKSVFDHNFRTKALRMKILVPRSMFWRSRNAMVPFILPVILTFQGHDLCKITFFAISPFLMGKTLPNFNTK